MPRKRLVHLYNELDLTTPVVGEFTGNDDIVRFYSSGGGWSPPPANSMKTVSQVSKSKGPSRKTDVNLIDVLSECLDVHDIEFKWRSQARGTCVGQASATCCDIVMAVSWLLSDSKFPSRSAVSTTYAGGRVEVSKNPGRWDGSWAISSATFCRDWGVATLEDIGLEETELVEDERLGIRWAAMSDGVPEKFETIAKTKPIIQTPAVTTAEELIKAIEAGCPVAHGSTLIPGQPNKNGVANVYSRGGHSTVFGGIRWVSGNVQVLYVNSWGLDWGIGGSVWIEMSDAVRILRAGDSFAYVGISGLDQEIKL